MFVVFFNTAAAKTKTRRRDWERQLMDDFVRAIHRRQYECGSLEELANRFGFIAHAPHDSSEYLRMTQDDANYVTLDSERYGTHKLPIAMYGIPQGYVSFSKILDSLRKRPTYILPFDAFYDIRQRNDFKGCYVEIIATCDLNEIGEWN